MNKIQTQVKEFHDRFGVPCPSAPMMPDVATRMLRENLIREEFKEFIQANSEDDLVGAVDAIADMLYVVFGAALAYGVDIEPVMDEVHRSNMSKLWTTIQTYEHKDPPALTFISVGQNRWIAKRADGKVFKSPSYKPADVAVEIERQRARGSE